LLTSGKEAVKQELLVVIAGDRRALLKLCTLHLRRKKISVDCSSSNYLGFSEEEDVVLSSRWNNQPGHRFGYRQRL
jgi:hypothetical protein